MTTIPASDIVSVVPGVLAAGGSAFDLNGLMLTASTRVPIGTVSQFPDSASVSDYFGGSSAEKAMADIYFAGFEGSTRKPGALLFAQYNQAAAAAYLRGGDISAMTLSQLQAITGGLSVTIDGYARTDSTIDMSGATSFSSAAGIIQSSLNGAIVALATFTAAIAADVMTVSAVASGVIGTGQIVEGGTVDPSTFILEQIGGTPGGIGTYRVSVSQTEASGTLTASPVDLAVTYDSVSGAFIVQSGLTGVLSKAAFATGTISASLKLTSATGAVLSQGAAAATPSTTMDAIVNGTRNWALFMTLFNPDVSGNTNKLAFAAWTNAQNSRYAYVAWDTDENPTTQSPAPTCLAQQLLAAEYNGTIPIYDPTAGSIAAFNLAIAASINTDELNGRTNFAFRRQGGLTPGATTAQVAKNLLDNGYNFYGAYATANDSFVWFYNGSISGPFKWADSFVNQIWMNDAFQVSLMNFLQQTKSVPYNFAGRGMIEAALADDIQAALSFGAIRAGVTLTANQASQVNNDAGVVIADVLSSRGWYLQILDTSPAQRQERGSPPMKFWYVDGQSVQSLNLASINVQ